MRIFEHRIFSKSFGGKIHHNWTDVTYRIIKQKNWRMRTQVFWRENFEFLNSP